MNNYSKDEQEPLWEQIASYLLAVVIGISFAALLVAWWSS